MYIYIYIYILTLSACLSRSLLLCGSCMCKDSVRPLALVRRDPPAPGLHFVKKLGQKIASTCKLHQIE